ncbi:MAG: PGF-pre-PGF domain-containing protein, partial [Methanosarcina sp.]
KGSIAMGQNGQKDLSLTAFDLPKGQYYLCVAAYTPGIGITGIAQSEIKIKSKQQYEEDEEDEEGEGGDNGGNGGNGGNNGGNGNTGNNGNNGNNGNSGNGGNGGTGENDGSNGGSGGSGGSGGAGAREPAKNINSKELCQKFVSNGDLVKFEFKKCSTCIDYIQFKAKKTVGKTTATIEELKGKSAFASREPEGEIYKHVNIWLSKSSLTNSNNIEDGKVGFRVNKDWVDKNHIDIGSLVLLHFSDKEWKALPTEKTGEDEKCIYFEAKTPSFSPFAISAGKNTVIIDNGKPDQGNSEDSPDDDIENDNGKAGLPSEENSNQTLLKVAAFFTGLAIILVVGAIIMKRKDGEEKGPEK